jgi:hypothetical protein
MRSVTVTFKTIIDEMTHATELKLVNSLHTKNAKLNH